ncbi:t-SNARE [Microthyrium microscopicum]|uniref:t-SNARE n=1 Tax=Microthyrium microscopicum TaxID=703497 RepID=A0A6A6U6J8_9PEZI|nr:t-SNARE [Microthyrium microscopicum]
MSQQYGGGNSYQESQYGSGGMYGGNYERYTGSEMEMQPPAYGYGGPQASGGNDMLEQCTLIDSSIGELDSRLSTFKALQSRILSDRASITELDGASSELMSSYRSLAQRMKKIKSNPESGSPRNAPQVGRVDRRLKTAMTDFQRLESDFRAQMRDQQARQYRIVNPNATEQEVQQAVEDPNAQIFQQALMNSDRRGQSQSALNAVRARNAAIQNIERQMIELAELFQDLDNIVMQQGEQVAQIEEKAVEVQDNIYQANTQLETGIKSARAARKKKWICLGICVFLLIAIAIVIAVVVVMRNPPGGKGPSASTPTPTA